MLMQKKRLAGGLKSCFFLPELKPKNIHLEKFNQKNNY